MLLLLHHTTLVHITELYHCCHVQYGITHYLRIEKL